MSNEFYEGRGRAISIDEEKYKQYRIDMACSEGYDFIETGEDFYVLVVPKCPEGMHPMKHHIALALRLVTTLSNNMKLNDTQGLPERWIHVLRMLGRFTGYMANCYSWREDKWAEFDAYELKDRVGHIKETLHGGRLEEDETSR